DIHRMALKTMVVGGCVDHGERGSADVNVLVGAWVEEREADWETANRHAVCGLYERYERRERGYYGCDADCEGASPHSDRPFQIGVGLLRVALRRSRPQDSLPNVGAHSVS